MLIRCPHCEYARTISATKIPHTAEVATCPKCKSRFRFRTLDPEEKPLIAPPESPKEKTPADIWEAVDALSRSLPQSVDKGRLASDKDRKRKRDADRESPTREPRRRRTDYPDYQDEQFGEQKRRRENPPAAGTPKRRRDDHPVPVEEPRRQREERVAPAEEAGYQNENTTSSIEDSGFRPGGASASAGEPSRQDEGGPDRDAIPKRRHNDPIALEDESRRRREEQRAARRAAERGSGAFAKGATAAAAAFKGSIAWALRRFTPPPAEPAEDTPYLRHMPLGIEHSGGPPAYNDFIAPPSVDTPAVPAQPEMMPLSREPLAPATAPAPFETEPAGPSWDPRETPGQAAQEAWKKSAESEKQPLSEEPTDAPAESEEELLPDGFPDLPAENEDPSIAQPHPPFDEAEAAATEEAGEIETIDETERPEPIEASVPTSGTPAGRATPPAFSDGPAVFPYSDDDDASPEERVARDILLLRDEGERPTRDLGHIDQWVHEDAGDTDGYTDIPWENQEVHGRFSGFVGTVRGMLLHPTAFFSGMPAYGSLAPAYLFFIIQSYIALLCTLLWRLAVSTVLNDAAMFPPTRLGLPILLLLTPLFMGLMLMFCTGVIRAFLRIMAPERADFPAAFKIICYASSAFVFCVIPLLGPAVGWVWFATTMVCGFRNVLGLSWPMAVLTALLPAVLLPGSMAALFF